MERNIYWKPCKEPGLEHLHFSESLAGYIADSIVLRLFDKQPIRFHYRIRCDRAWRTKEVKLQLLEIPGRELTLRTNGNGSWKDGHGNPCEELSSCLDVEISATPFTNTLVIRRLNMKLGESATVQVAYLALPELQARPVKQRYTFLKKNSDGGIYRYEGLTTGFTADITVDEDGFVLDYPQAWTTVANEKKG